MAGVHFSFDNFKQLIDLTIGIADRLDENRAESFTILYCDFSTVKKDVIDTSLEEVLRTSDSIVNHDKDYFFVLPYTDSYGAKIVKGMFDEFFSRDIESYAVHYPKDGESPKALLGDLQDNVSTLFQNDLNSLDRFSTHL